MREIDDYSIFGINTTVRDLEKLRLRGLDDVVAIARLLVRCINWEERTVEVEMTDGKVWKADLRSMSFILPVATLNIF